VIPNGEKRILVVENQITVGDALNLVLKMDGYEVEAAVIGVRRLGTISTSEIRV